MTSSVGAKELLAEYNQKHYREFTLNGDVALFLPEISAVPWVGASTRRDLFEKKWSHPGRDHHIKFITKNQKPHAFLWQTNAEKLKEGVRWGIINTYSMTGNVIAALGQYRVIAHTGVAKGMLTTLRSVKLRLIDLYQDRFAALQEIESLVNKDNTVAIYEKKLGDYIQKLVAIDLYLTRYFSDIDIADSGFNDNTIAQIRSDLQADIARSKSYLDSLKTTNNINVYNLARGQYSVMEFVKIQMIDGLYELQGINKDLTYSKQHSFALTSGELNDVIEDARKAIDDHQPDLRNAVTAKHHGDYAADNEPRLSYDFTEDQLTPEREREVLLAISFIERWDGLDNSKNHMPTVSNQSGNEELDTITAPKWKTHRNFTMWMKSFGFYMLNMFKSIFVATKPWEEESWHNENFHLVATDLRKHARPNEPLWQKPVKFFTQVFNAVVDVFKGIRDFGAKLVIRMPADILNDWESTQLLSSLNTLQQEVEKHIGVIKTTDEARLAEILRQCGFGGHVAVSPSTSKLVRMEYELNSSDQNDILTAIARGLNRFSGVFSHNIFAKDPLRGLLFTGAYAIGAGAIYLPSMTTSIFGADYVNWFTRFSYSMGSSKFAAAVAGGSTQAQLFAVAWDSVEHGPSSDAVNALYRIGEDPLTLGAYVAAAYGIGYVLANGIAGCDIPWLSERLRDDLGALPEAGYPIIGAKFAVLLYEGLMAERSETEKQPQLSSLLDSLQPLTDADRGIIDRYRLASWLSAHADDLPKLESRLIFNLSRHIDALFCKEESKSLCKLLYPKTNHSIAFQVLYIPLSYIPGLLRLALSPLLSVAALVSKKPYPWEPVKQAAGSLLDKSKKDLSRLIVFTTHMLYIPYTLITSLVKMTASIGMMILGRIAGLFDAKPAHALHRAFAAMHTFFREVGEFLFPARVLKEVAIAHPIHTIGEVESSYVKLITRIGESARTAILARVPPLENIQPISPSPVLTSPEMAAVLDDTFQSPAP